VRQHFFGKYPELLAMVAHLSDDEIYALNRGGHDPFKVFVNFLIQTSALAMNHPVFGVECSCMSSLRCLVLACKS
jgi:pyruvate dehydrogenase complex dehydrogenase (E1) component